MTTKGMQHPMARPTFLCLPDRVRGIPIFLDILVLAPEMPRARFQENEKPNFLAIENLPIYAHYSCLPHHQATFPIMALLILMQTETFILFSLFPPACDQQITADG
jgi:hypothetical protein